MNSRREALGGFALRWSSHGLRYGIGVEMDAWLAGGAAVIVNGSRAHLPQAHARYPALTAVEIRVDPALLARRLAGRGRESEADIAQRLARAAQEFPVPEGCRLIRLDNNEAPDVAAAALLDQVRSVLSGAPKAAVTATTATPR